MIWIVEAWSWLTDPSNWVGSDGIGARMLTHLAITLGVVLLSSALAIPIGLLVGHSGRGLSLAVFVTGGLRALPTLGVLTLFALAFGVGIGAPVFALVLLAIPSVLAGTYAGVRAIERQTVDAAHGVGMRSATVLFRVELPLALPSLWGGVRSAVLQVVATATLAAYVGAGGLGGYIFLALKTRDYALAIAGSMLIVGLAFVLDLVFASLARWAVPRGVRRARSSSPISPTRITLASTHI